MSDIPEDQKLHYIVKDYKRMFEQHNQLVKACKEYQDLLQKRDNRIRDLERQVENLKQAPPPTPSISPKQVNPTISEIEGQVVATLRRVQKDLDALTVAKEKIQNLKEMINQ